MRTIERSEQLSGAPFPAALGERFAAVADDPVAVRALGIEEASAMCRSGCSPRALRASTSSR